MTFYFKVNDKPVKVTFQSCKEGGYFTTSDVNLQKAMENSSLFNKKYSLANTMEDKERKKVTGNTAIVESVTNISQARQYLIDMGIPAESIKNAGDIKKYAKLKKVSFPNIGK